MLRILTGLILLSLGSQIHAQADPYLMGRARMMEEKYSDAAMYLEQALDLAPGDEEVMYHLGICYLQDRNLPAAHEQFYKVNKEKPGMGAFYLAKCEVRMQHPELALKYLREHLKSRYKVSEKEILLDPDLSSLENSSDWQHLWEERKWYSERDLQFQEAMFLKEHDRELEAINILNDLEKLSYNKSKVREEKARIYMTLGNEKAARNTIREAVDSDVRNLDALELLCGVYLEDEKWEDAGTYLHRLIRQDPARFEAYLMRARSRSALDDLDGAREDMQLYLDIFPDAHAAWFEKGQIEFNHGKYLNALQAFHKAIELDSGEAAYYLARGRTYAATGTTRSAEKDLSMALDLDPFNGETWYEKARISQRLGKMEDACSCFKKAYQYGIYEAGEIVEINCE